MGSVKIDIDIERIDALIKFDEQQRHKILLDMKPYQDKLNSIDREIEQLSKKREEYYSQNPKMTFAGVGVMTELYNPSWTWHKKIEHALTFFNGEPVTCSNIVDYILTLEPNLINNRRTVMRSLSSTLSVNGKKKFIKGVNTRNENTFVLNKQIPVE